MDFLIRSAHFIVPLVDRCSANAVTYWCALAVMQGGRADERAAAMYFIQVRATAKSINPRLLG